MPTGTHPPHRRPRAGTDPVDHHVGRRLAGFRTTAGLSREDLARILGISANALARYEKGESRIGAATLFRAAKALGRPLAAFYHGLPDAAGSLAPAAPPAAEAPWDQRETRELVQHFFQIDDEGVRRRLMQLCRSVARSVGADDAAPQEEPPARRSGTG